MQEEMGTEKTQNNNNNEKDYFTRFIDNCVNISYSSKPTGF